MIHNWISWHFRWKLEFNSRSQILEFIDNSILLNAWNHLRGLWQDHYTIMLVWYYLCRDIISIMMPYKMIEITKNKLHHFVNYHISHRRFFIFSFAYMNITINNNNNNIKSRYTIFFFLIKSWCWYLFAIMTN